MKKQKKINFFTFIFWVPIEIFLDLFTEERKTQYVFNRDTNTFSIIEKALFKNAYKIIKKYPLDEITKAVTNTYTDNEIIDGECSKYEKLELKTKSGKLISLKLELKYLNKINTFLAGNESKLIIKHSPFKVRLLTIFFTILFLYLFIFKNSNFKITIE